MSIEKNNILMLI